MKQRMLIAAVVFSCFCSTVVLGQNKKEIPLAKESDKKSSPLCLHDCGSNSEKAFDVNNKTYTGETIRGPRTVVAFDLNPLRYTYKWQSNVTYSAAPDLWSKLTGLAAPQSSPQPAAPSSNPPKPSSSQTGHADRAAVQVPGAAKAMVKKGQPPISQASKDLAKKAQAAIDAAALAVENVNEQIMGVDQNLKDSISANFKNVTSQVVLASAAVKNVLDAGQELVSFLNNTGASSLGNDIQNELSNSADFKFMSGVNAQWPDLGTVTNLHDAVDSTKAILSTKKSAFDAAQPSLLAALSVSQRDLETAYDNLKQQDVLLNGTSSSDAELTLVNESIADLQERMNEVDLAKRNLQSASETLSWAISESTAMQASLSDLDSSSDKYKSFQTGQVTLVQWKHQMAQLKSQLDAYKADKANNSNPLVTSFSAGCDYTFATTKQAAIKLTQVDNLPDKTAKPPADVISLTMECASPFALSAGVAFNTIPNNQFAIQPVATPQGSTTTVNEFVQTSNSRFHPAPIAMVSARLCEPNETVSFHLSLGVAGNFNSQANGGSTASFLIGPSIALFRTMYFTPGWYIGTKTTLGSGFRVSDPVPPTVTTPPVNSSYTSGFGLAITFTKP
jgi:hypothetical protein